jgi:hypothetical protein
MKKFLPNHVDILSRALRAVDIGLYFNNRLIHAKNSIKNMHFEGVDSIWISPTIRCWVTDKSIPGIVSSSNDGLLIHSHRHALTSIPVFGHQENIIYEAEHVMKIKQHINLMGFNLLYLQMIIKQNYIQMVMRI